MQRTKGFMSDELYRKCIDEVAAVDRDTQVWLADHGETLIIGQEIIDKVRHAKSQGLTQVYLNTNGMLLTPEISRGLVDAGLDGLFFGIDAATKETHAAIRRGGDLDTVLRNIDFVVQEIARTFPPGGHNTSGGQNASGGHNKPAVWVQFIEMDENEHEREAFAEYWAAEVAKGKDVGVKIRRKLSWGGYIGSPAVRRAATERIPCPWIINLMHILWDGRVGRCTGDHECNYPMGNVYDSTISDIWTGPLRRERQIHLDYRFDLLNDQCQQCIDWGVGAAERRPYTEH
jgi:sulfatase maturation enzyme AslB (radical SAM superfamily)